MNPTQLYDVLVQIPVGVFDAVRAAVPDAQHLPGGDASRAKISLAIAARAEADTAILRAVDAVLDRASVPFRQPPVVRWQLRQLEDSKHIPIVGFHDKSHVHLPIDAIYVPLGFGAPERAWRHGLDPQRRDRGGLEELPKHGDITIEEAAADLEARIDEGALLHGLAIVGLPGSGKTTLLKHLRVDQRLLGPTDEGGNRPHTEAQRHRGEVGRSGLMRIRPRRA